MSQNKVIRLTIVMVMLPLIVAGSVPAPAKAEQRTLETLEIYKKSTLSLFSGSQRLSYKWIEYGALSKVGKHFSQPIEVKIARGFKVRKTNSRLHRKVRPYVGRRINRYRLGTGSANAAVSPSDVIFDIVGADISTAQPPSSPPPPPPQHDDDCMSCAD